MKIKIIAFFLILLGGFVYSYDYLEIATIPNTAVLNFWGQQNGKFYETHIEDSEFFLVTGNDDKLYPCYSIYGSGYTDTLGEVFFGYNDNLSYVCGDYTLRGVAKLSAGGRFYLDDRNATDGIDWVTLVDDDYYKENGWYYHSELGDSTGDGEVFSDGNGFFRWNTAKTDFNPYISTAEKINNSTFEIQKGKRADGVDKAIFRLRLIADDGSIVPNFKIKHLKFLTDNSDFVLDTGSDKLSTLFFAEDYSNRTTNNKGELLGFANSVMPIDGQFSVEVGFFSGDDTITKVINGTTNFTYPFTYDVLIEDNTGDSKVLIGDAEKGKFVLNNYGNSITISSVKGTGALSGYVSDGRVIDPETFVVDMTNYDNFKVKVWNENPRIGEKVQLFYNIEGKYDITIGGTTYSGIDFDTITSFSDIYLNKNIDTIEFGHEPSLSPDGNKVNNFRLQFLNEDGNYIHSLSTNFYLEDSQWKNIDNTVADFKYKTFDIDEFTATYDKGYFVETYDTKTDIEGKLKFGVVSYKPVMKGQFDVVLQNISGDSDDVYTWSQANRTVTTDEFSFYEIVNLNFAGDVVNKGISVNISNELDIKFTKDSNHVDDANSGYQLVGTIKGCSDCVFSGSIGSSFSSSSFGIKTAEIFVFGSVEPTAVDYYDQKYYYRLNGIKGTKDIILKPNIESSNLRIIGKLIEPLIIGLVSRSWYNSNNITVIDTKIPASAFISRYVQKVKEATRGKSEDFVGNITVDLSTITETVKVYKCSNDTFIKLSGTYNHSLDLYFKNCRLDITGDIKKGSTEYKLRINMINDDNYKKVDLDYDDGWDVPSNIFINNNVGTIQAHIFTEGSLFSYKNSIIGDNIFTPNRRLDSDFSKQLYIKGKLVSRNTVGGGVTNEFNEVQVVGGARFNKDSTDTFNRKALDVSQGYDIFFWRSSYVLLNTNNYDITKVAPDVITKFNCTGDAINDERACLTPIVIEYER